MGGINPVLSTGLTLSPHAGSADSKSPEKIRDAASQFESLLIGQVFKTIHEDNEGWLGTGEDDSASSVMGLADEYFAQAISKRGGLGLAQMIARQLADASSSNPGSQPTPDPAHTSNSGD